MRFGKLTAMRPTDKRSKIGSVIWECKCDCGKTFLTASSKLTGGIVTNCGCGRVRRSKKTSGGTMERSNSGNVSTGSRLGRVWGMMLTRCENKNHSSYQYYGGKGIKACDEWHDFEVFRMWCIDNGYDETSDDGRVFILRIDVFGDYCPSNCLVECNAKNAVSRRKTGKHVIDSNGESYLSITECAEKTGIKKATLTRHIREGTPIDGITYTLM